MTNDKIWIAYCERYIDGMLKWLEYELECCKFDTTTNNIIIVLNTAKLSNLEIYLFNKYWVEFVRELKSLLLLKNK